MSREFLLGFSCQEDRTSLPAKTRHAIGSPPQMWRLLSSNHIPSWFLLSSSSLFPPQRVLVYRGRLFCLSTFLSAGQHSTKYICVVDCASRVHLNFTVYIQMILDLLCFFFFNCTWWLDLHIYLPPPPLPCTALPHILRSWLCLDDLSVEGTCSDATFVLNFSVNSVFFFSLDSKVDVSSCCVLLLLLVPVGGVIPHWVLGFEKNNANQTDQAKTKTKHLWFCLSSCWRISTSAERTWEA